MLYCNCGPSYLESHSPQWVCVCPGNATVCGCEWISVGCTEGTLAVTGWRPTAEEDEGGEEVEVEAEMAVVGTKVEERAGPGEEEEVGESDGRSKETSVEAGGEEEGEDT